MCRKLFVLSLAVMFVPSVMGDDKETTKERRSSRGRDRVQIEVKDPKGFYEGTERVFSGPQPGEELPTFDVTGLAGDHKDKTVDPVSKAGKQRHLLIFQDDTGVAVRGLYGMVRMLGSMRKKTDRPFQISVVFLSDDVEQIKRFSNVFPRLLESGVDVVAVSKDGRAGPGVLGLDRNIAQTIVLAKDNKVIHNFVFKQGMLLPDPHVLGGIAELIGVERGTFADWAKEHQAEQQKMRRGRMNRSRQSAE